MADADPLDIAVTTRVVDQSNDAAGDLTLDLFTSTDSTVAQSVHQAHHDAQTHDPSRLSSPLLRHQPPPDSNAAPSSLSQLQTERDPNAPASSIQCQRRPRNTRALSLSAPSVFPSPSDPNTPSAVLPPRDPNTAPSSASREGLNREIAQTHLQSRQIRDHSGRFSGGCRSRQKLRHAQQQREHRRRRTSLKRNCTRSISTFSVVKGALMTLFQHQNHLARWLRYSKH